MTHNDDELTSNRSQNKSLLNGGSKVNDSTLDSVEEEIKI